eukprot:SAG31_NODE_3477_length_4226_cov_2.472256_4_plen_34_part_00
MGHMQESRAIEITCSYQVNFYCTCISAYIGPHQ